MKLCIVVASTRPGRIGAQVGGWFHRRALDHGGFDVSVADLAGLGLPLLDEAEHPADRVYAHEHTRRWSAIVDSADAFVFVTPEYNYGMPATLKNALDFLYHEWAYKPAAFVSYGMTAAGTRGVQMSKQVITTLRMFPIGASVAIPLRDQVDDDGLLRVPEYADSAASEVLDELALVAPAFAQLHSTMQ